MSLIDLIQIILGRPQPPITNGGCDLNPDGNCKP
jgi:hypothetical protein